ncbi:DUF2853 family protein [Paracoccus sp. (in: a-proteobacteria)]|uniref:DUF2853 family protein n=1 Tax=Paracoccus sp. TaxID=267 RepID=UPI00321F7A47
MGKRDDLIAKYAADMQEKFGASPDMDLLRKVVIGCGPSIYDADAETVAGSDKTEVARIRQNYLIGKLGLAEGPELDAAIDKVLAQYGSSNRHKYRAVVYYQLCAHFGRQAAYG